MNILFLGPNAVHHPLIAANIYLDRLNKPDFRFVRGFCDTYHDESGLPIFVDEDSDGNRVYVLGVGPEVEVGRRSIEDLTLILGCSSEDLQIKPVSIRGEKVLYYIGKIPKIIGGRYLNTWLASFLIGRDFEHLQEQVKASSGEMQPSQWH